MKEENYIREKTLANQPHAISIDFLRTSGDLARTRICKINYKEGCYGSGFLCNIQIDWNNYVKVLMTNNHILNKNDIQPGKTIEFSIDNDMKLYRILIDNTRKTYTDEYNDVTFIEIIEDDKIDEQSFFDLDQQIFEKDLNNRFRQCQILLLHYPNGKEVSLSTGIIKNINEENNTILHLCDTSECSAGGPIINTSNFQIIGIHKGGAEGNNYNIGILLKEPVENFRNKKESLKQQNSIQNIKIGKELDNLPKAIPLKAIDILVDLARNSICKIYCEDGAHGCGFFCNIPNGWNNYVKVLMTNNNVLNKNDILPNKTIKFSIDNDKQLYSILIDNMRRTYTNQNYDITFIEIKEDDKINEKSFFDLDRQIFKENSKDFFSKCQIFLLHYPKGKEMSLSTGIIKQIKEDNYTICHFCDTSGGSSGGPIINTTNYQIIGIHKGAALGHINYNLGTLLNEPIKKFNEELKKK